MKCRSINRVIGLVVVLVSAAGCSAATVPLALDNSRRLVATGDLEGADSTLRRCSDAHQADAEGMLCRYRLLLVRLDPAYPGSPKSAVVAGNAILALDGSATNRDEVVLLTRIAVQRVNLVAEMDSLRNLRADKAAVLDTRLRSDEDARLKAEREKAQAELEKTQAELAKTQDELQRIKKRLAAPRP